MARPKNFARVAEELKTLQQSLSSVVEQTKKLSKSLAGGLERQLLSRIAVFEADIQRRIEDSTAALAPMVDLLSELSGISVRRPASGAKRARPASRGKNKKTSPASPARRRGGRGIRVELSAEQLKAALSEAKGVKSRAAQIAGVSVPTFNKKLAEAGLAGGGKRAGGRKKRG
ncbi:MAG: helix-turn-helix domain-containing protein [bacterium]